VAVAEHLGSDTFLHVDVPGVGNLTARSIGELASQPAMTSGCCPIPAAFIASIGTARP